MIPMKQTLIVFALLGVVAVTGFTGCYYDNEEYLYPSNVGCDTMTVSFSQRLMPIINDKCITCHNASLVSGGIVLETHADVASNIELIIPAIDFTGPHPMPQGGAKLPNCDIAAFVAWRNHGSNDN
jgi:hypothetical protein